MCLMGSPRLDDRRSMKQASYFGATEDDLESARSSRRLVAMIDQRRLFPHRGLFRLDTDTHALVLGGWRDIERSSVTSIEMGFTTTYSRLLAAGSRGRWPSLGWIGNLGQPLVVGIRDEPPVYLLVDFTWWSGINENRRWLQPLRRWWAQAGGAGSSPA